MKYDFDLPVDRRGTNSVKYDFAAERGKPGDVLPLWVADMDFTSPQEVTESMVRRAAHGIYGYSDPKEAYYAAVAGWFSRRHGLFLEPSWIVPAPGVVFAINTAIRAFTKEGEGVLVQKPVYYPFFKSVVRNRRRVVNNALVEAGGVYRVDFSDFEEKIVSENVRLFLLCSPHNPVARVWTKEELSRMLEICKRHGVVVVSDEVHSDFAFTRTHTPAWNAAEGADGITLLCTSTGKTFNQAGLQQAGILIKNPDLKKRFLSELYSSGHSNMGIFGMVASQAAYAHGDEWLAELKEYLLGNVRLVRSCLQEKLPGVLAAPHEGTYLMWLDFRSFDLSQTELDERLLRHGVWLNSGTIFGDEGAGFMRINIATQRKVLREAMERIASAF